MAFKRQIELSNLLRSKWFIFFWLFFLSFLSYFASLKASFFGDDIYRIAYAPDLGSLKEALSGELRDRPLLIFSVWWDKIFLGLNPFWMRLENIFFHSLVGLQLFLFLKQILKFAKKEISTTTLVLLVSIFVLHPLHNQTINLVIQRGVLFSAFFSLLSLRFFFSYLEDQKHTALVCSVFSFAFGLLSKQNILFLPLFYLLTYLALTKNKKNYAWLSLYLVPLFIPFFFYFVFKVNDQNSLVTPSPLAYFLMQTQVLMTYFKLMLVPYGLKYLYDFFPPESFLFTRLWFYFLAHLLILGIVWRLVRERIVYIWFLGFYLAFIPESSFFPIIHPAFEHRCYLPLLFLFIFVALLISKIKNERRVWSILSLLALIYLGLNQIRNDEVSDINRWKLHTLENSYSRHMYNFNFSVDLLQAGFVKELEPTLKKYHELYPQADLYKVLFAIETYYKNSQSKASLIEISNMLQRLDFPPAQREAINLVFIKVLGQPNSRLDDLILLEEILSMQLKIFKADTPNYSLLLENYQNLASRLLQETTNETLNLKLRSILFYYFARPDSTLKQEVERSFKKDPHSKLLIRLHELLQ